MLECSRARVGESERAPATKAKCRWGKRHQNNRVRPQCERPAVAAAATLFSCQRISKQAVKREPTYFVIGGVVFLWGRGGVSTGAVRAVAAVTLAVQAQSDGGGREAEVRGQPHTDTTHRAHCEETLTGWGGRTLVFRNSFKTAFLNWRGATQKWVAGLLVGWRCYFCTVKFKSGGTTFGSQPKCGS